MTSYKEDSNAAFKIQESSCFATQLLFCCFENCDNTFYYQLRVNNTKINEQYLINHNLFVTNRHVQRIHIDQNRNKNIPNIVTEQCFT